MTTHRLVDTVAKAQFHSWDYHPDDPYEKGFARTADLTKPDRTIFRLQMAERKRKKLQRDTDRASEMRTYRQFQARGDPSAESWNPNKPYRPTSSVYRDYGYTSRDLKGRQSLSNRITSELNEPSVPSSVHRNIHYGASIPEVHHRGLDARIDPAFASKLRHPVVFHHAPDLSEDLSAAALGAHTATGNKGHVALKHVTPKALRADEFGRRVGMRRLIGHELMHASKRGINPRMTMKRAARYTGEEGRADTISGANAYIKGRVFPPNPPKRTSPIKYFMGTDAEYHYHRVTSAIKAARKIVKSEYAPGRYKPVTQMDAIEQLGVYHTATGNRIVRRHVGKPVMPARWDTRDKTRVYEDYGYFRRSDPKRAVKEMAEPSTPSAVHPNVHYGASIPAEHHARLDRKIDPKLSAALKHPVVIHHEPYLKVGEAALGAHVTTGNKGHVVLSGLTRRPGDAGMRRIINHELVHASTSGTNPVMTAARTGRQMGEEARADAISGANLYRKFVPETATHYHKVHALIRAARKVRP